MSFEHEIELKQEPAGEVFFGKLDDSLVEELRNLHGKDEYNDCLLVISPTSASTIDHETGMCPESDNINVISSNTLPTEDGFYIVATYFSKYSLYFTFENEDDDEFDESEFSEDVVSFDFGNIVIDDFYRISSIDLVSCYKYKGEMIREAAEAEMIDRGIDKQITIFQVKNRKAKVIYKISSNGGWKAFWDDFWD